MIKFSQIEKLSEETSLPVIEIIRALVENGGDSDVARTALALGKVARVEIAGRGNAEHLAATFAGAGLHFTCEETDGASWEFRVAPDSIAPACILGHLSLRRAK